LYVYFAKRQNDKNVKSKSRAFTLLETVFTITIIGILLAIFLQVVSAIKLSAQKLKDASNLQKVAAAWRECTINRGWVIDGKHVEGNNAIKLTLFTEQLAGARRTNISDMVFNDPYAYISPGDKYASKITKESLCYFDTSQQKITWWGAPSLVKNFMISAASTYFFSYCFVCNLPAHVPLDTTPLGFTRGLREDGKWDEKAGLYGAKGGYVVFCDGHTTWFDGSKPARFLKWDQSGYTSNIREAIPSSAFIACGNDGTKIDYISDGQLVIFYHAGTGGD
jgi:hypothetical protein